MANAIYGRFKASLMIQDPGTNLLTGVVRIALLSSSYTFDASHTFISDIPAVARVAISGPLTFPTVSVPALAAYKTADITFASVTGSPVVALAMFIDTGVATSSRLVFYQDTNATGIPFTPSGAAVTLTVNSNGWFIL